MRIEGGCYCGAVRYEITSEIKTKSQCHCRECQYLSGGGPNFFMLVPQQAFNYISGAPKAFTRTDIENPVTREFCAECGTHLLTKRPVLDKLFIKAGTLDDPSIYGNAQAAIFTIDAQPFHHIPEGMPAFERMPKR